MTEHITGEHAAAHVEMVSVVVDLESDEITAPHRISNADLLAHMISKDEDTMAWRAGISKTLKGMSTDYLLLRTAYANLDSRMVSVEKHGVPESSKRWIGLCAALIFLLVIASYADFGMRVYSFTHAPVIRLAK